MSKVETTRNARLASIVIVFYDYALSLDFQIDLIWRSEWHFLKVVFLINRYYVLAAGILLTNALSVFFSSNLSSKVGLNYVLWEAWTGLIGCVLAEIILQMRISALYLRNKRIVYPMVASFLASSTASATIMGIYLRGIDAFPIDIPGGQICYSNHSPHLYAFWIPILSFECLLCALALAHGYQDYRDSLRGFGSRLIGALDTPKLSEILVRDSITYFFSIGAVYMACLIVWIVDQNALIEAPAGFSIAMSSVLVCRLILNLREANANQAFKYSLYIPTSNGIVVSD
ncbi:hypothetical protein CPB84DRAFT_1776389 [Gymnopilus junonius]|uniref:DUF6533 domain-containing protein n=1 Tax=Gymnopilus junonius TaxID=109634 RepID=A0A9P5NMM5_GYMJU|nr:hypothetical protein CPB84DRAFT_1776389 [Gymnopilus junonius]